MNIDWYVFEESYLINITYNISKCILILHIDAKISKTNPNASKIKSYEDTFEEIQIIFNKVQFYTGIASTNLLTNPNDDIGSVHHLYIKSQIEQEDGVQISNDNGRISIRIINKGEIFSGVSTKGTNLMYIEFNSEMIAFKAGFESYIIELQDGEVVLG